MFINTFDIKKKIMGKFVLGTRLFSQYRIGLFCILSFMFSFTTSGQDKYLFDGNAGINRHGSILERVELCKKNGFNGIGFIIKNNWQLAAVDSFVQTELIALEQFPISFAYITITDQDKIKKIDICKKILTLIPGCALWINFYGKNIEYEQLIKRLCLEAQKVNSDIILYPHPSCTFETVEEIIPVIEKLKQSNLYASFSFKHERNMGSKERIFDVLIKSAPYLKYVVIRGIDLINGNSDTYLKECLSGLNKIDFKGEVILSLFLKKNDSFIDFLSRATSKLDTNIASVNFEKITDIHWHKQSKSWLTISTIGNEKENKFLSGGWLTKITEKGNSLNGKWIKKLPQPRVITSNKEKIYILFKKGIALVDPKTKKIVRTIKLSDSNGNKVNARDISSISVHSKGIIYALDTVSNKIVYFSTNGKTMDFYLGNSSQKITDFCLDKKNLFFISRNQENASLNKETLGILNLKTKKRSFALMNRQVGRGTKIIKQKNKIYLFDKNNRIDEISKKGDVKIKHKTNFSIHTFGFDKKKGVILLSNNNEFTLQKINSLAPLN